MNTDSIKKNYILNTLLQVFRLLIPLITAPYISRVFEADGVGIRSFTTSVMSIFLIFAVLGTNSYGQQTIAQCRDSRRERSRQFWNIFAVCCITTSCTLLCWVGVILIYKKYSIYLLVLTIQIVAACLDISWYFAALEKFSQIVFRNIFIKIITAVLLFTFIRTKDDLLLYIFLESAGILICNLSMWIPLVNSIDKPCFKDLKLKPHFKQTLVYFLPTIASSVYSYIDKAMIGVITNSYADNGYYEQAQSIINMSFILVSSLNTVMASRNAYLFSKGRIDEVKNKLKLSLSFVLSLSIPLMCGIYAISDNFVSWFFGPGYDHVILLLKIGSPLVVFLSIHNYLAAQYLVPSGKRAKSTIGVIAGAITNFICNIVLIPLYRSVGAIIATILSELVICIVYFYMSKGFVSVISVIKAAVKPFIAAITMFIIVWIIGSGHKGEITITIMQITVGMLAYFMTLGILRNEFVEYAIGTIKRR